MRGPFIDELLKLAAADPRIILLTADLGFGALDKFKTNLPGQFLNVGVSEQNLMGVAAGLALRGNIPIAYSIGNFSSFRCLEQIRNDICYHNLPVKIVSVGSGLSYGTHGYSHFAIEDVGVMRPLPRLHILSPGDAHEAAECARLAVTTDGPFYIRLGKAGPSPVHQTPPKLEIGSHLVVKSPQKVTVIAFGPILWEGNDAVNKLAERGMKIGLVSTPVLKPFNGKLLGDLQSSGTETVVVLDEHVRSGGVFGIVAEEAVLKRSDLRLVDLTLPDIIETIGNREWLLEEHGLRGVRLDEKLVSVTCIPDS